MSNCKYLCSKRVSINCSEYIHDTRSNAIAELCSCIFATL